MQGSSKKASYKMKMNPGGEAGNEGPLGSDKSSPKDAQVYFRDGILYFYFLLNTFHIAQVYHNK